MSRLLLLTLLAALAAPAWGWNAAGHRLVASIAWRAMPTTTRERVADLLASHPDADRWVGNARVSPDFAAFLGASTWPDDIRNDRRFHEDDDEVSGDVPHGFDWGRHRHWHYVDLAPGGKQAVGRGALDLQLERLIRLLHTAGVARHEKVYALPWVIHLLGDIHQPLHVGSRPDDGGNRYEIEDPRQVRLPFTSLHRWWDDRPGPPWLHGHPLEKETTRLMAAPGPLPEPGNVMRWLDESWRISNREAYPSHPLLSAEFRARAQEITDRRLFEAGIRLARLLQSIFATVPRETRQEMGFTK